jgi:hypothetical protein
MLPLTDRLSPNFTFGELVKSPTASRLGIDNTPADTEVLANLRAVCGKILQPVRDHFKQPVVINSGYRSFRLNKAIGGASSSQHLDGNAVDFEIPGLCNGDLAKWVSVNLDYDQLILEHCELGQPGSGWVHCSYRRDGRNRKQILTIFANGRTATGLVV